MEVAEVEKAIEKLNGFKNITILYGGTFGMTIEQLKQIQEAIETVLQELENKDVEIYKLKQTNKLQENSIPKQKIKYKIEELREVLEKKEKIYNNISSIQNGKTIGLALRLYKDIKEIPENKLYGIINSKNCVILTNKEVISKNKIEIKIEELIKERDKHDKEEGTEWGTFNSYQWINSFIDDLQQLLED